MSALGAYEALDQKSLIQACKEKDEEIKMLKEENHRLRHPRLWRVLPEGFAQVGESFSNLYNNVFRNRTRHGNSLYVLENDGLDEFIENNPAGFQLVTNASEEEFVEDFSVASALRAEKSATIGVHLSGKGDISPSTGFVGTRGEWRQLEGFFISECPFGLTLRYSAHLAGKGDVEFVTSPAYLGTQDEWRGMEGFTVEIVGDNPKNYKLTYMAHVSRFGDTAWVKEGCYCGTRGLALSIEGIEIRIRPRHILDPSPPPVAANPLVAANPPVADPLVADPTVADPPEK